MFMLLRLNQKATTRVETQVDITKDLTISTVYDSSTSFKITSSDGSCTPSVSTAYWDQKVTVTNSR